MAITTRQRKRRKRTTKKRESFFWCRRHRSARIEMRPYFPICHLLGWSASLQKYHSKLDIFGRWQTIRCVVFNGHVWESIHSLPKPSAWKTQCVFDVWFMHKQSVKTKTRSQSHNTIVRLYWYPFFINASPHFGSFQWKKNCNRSAHCTLFHF